MPERIEYRVVMDLRGDTYGSFAIAAGSLEAAKMIAQNPEAFFDESMRGPTRGHTPENVRIESRTISEWTVVEQGGTDDV